MVGCYSNTTSSKPEKATALKQTIQAVKIENLLRDSLESAEGIEVIISYVEIPKATTLPLHYHPGEEFAYLIEGSGELLLEDQTKIALKAGEAGKVPLKQTHSFSTLNEEAKLVVFRVHEKGQPDRILVE
jgi:quercetin dioxygenase-like cupin family protein